MIRTSKSIERIFEEAKGYDLVITNDAPLATALNRLVEAPRLGYFAMTPRQIASKFSVSVFSRLFLKNEVIVEITKLTGEPLKIIHQNLEKIWEIWNYTGLLDSCKKHFPESTALILLLEKFPTIEMAMENFDEAFYEDKKIAVIGIELFNELDKQVLPRKGKFPDTIGLFSEENFHFEKSYLFNSFNELVNQTVALINKENENEVAIVLNPDSEYLNVIKARLRENNISLNLKEFLSSDIRTRNILSLISLSFEISDLKVSDVILLESILDSVKIDRKYSNYFLRRYMDSVNGNQPLKSIYEFMCRIGSYTYEEFFETLKKNYRIEVRGELVKITEHLELAKEKINADNLNLINYFIRFIDAEVSRSGDGVLIVNALNSAFIDRHIVFFIGMDESWTRINPEKSYSDRKEEEEKNLAKFQVLLSQGKVKFNFVLGVKENVIVSPCYYFNILADRNISGFENEFFKATRVKYAPNIENKESKHIPRSPADIRKVTEISPSALAEFVNCPKGYSYSYIMPDEEQPHFTKGNLLHYFAEFYFNYPEYATENFEFLLEKIVDKYKGFIKDSIVNIEKTNFRIGMKVIKLFLDEKPFDKLKPDKIELFNNNFLFELTGKEKLYSNTEQRLSGNRAKISGKIDLFSGNTIVDYKSGRAKKLRPSILQEFKMEEMKENLDSDIGFQTVAYMAGKRDDVKGNLEFIYVYLLSEIGNFITDNFELENIFSNVTYIPKTFREYIESREGYDFLLARDTKEKIFEKLGFEDYKRVISENFDEECFYDKNTMKNVFGHPIREVLITKGFAKTQYLNNVDSAIGVLFGIRAGTKNYGSIFKDDVDKFLKTVDTAIREINEFQKNVFPNRPLFDLRDICRDCEYLKICIGNKLWSGNETSVKTESAG